MYHVRRAEVQDAPTIERIWHERLSGDQLPDETATRRIVQMVKDQDDVFQCWVLEVDGEVQGWASLAPMRNSPTLRNTMAEISNYISPGHRAKGYGLILAERAIEHAAKTPLEWLWAFAGKNNVGAWKHLERLGFKLAFELGPVAKQPNRDQVLVYVLPVGNLYEKVETTPTSQQ